jgi:hypothetical protein
LSLGDLFLPHLFYLQHPSTPIVIPPLRPSVAARAPARCSDDSTRKLKLRPSQGRQRAGAQAPARRRGARTPPAGSWESIYRCRVSPVATRIELDPTLAYGHANRARSYTRRCCRGQRSQFSPISWRRCWIRPCSSSGRPRRCKSPNFEPTSAMAWASASGSLARHPNAATGARELGTMKTRDSGWRSPLVAAHSFDSRWRATSSYAHADETSIDRVGAFSLHP